jgi:hypothetical protein
MSLRNFLFMRRHKRACKRVTDSARELARIGHEKRHRIIADKARKMREQLGLQPDPRIA